MVNISVGPRVTVCAFLLCFMFPAHAYAEKVGFYQCSEATPGLHSAYTAAYASHKPARVIQAAQALLAAYDTCSDELAKEPLLSTGEPVAWVDTSEMALKAAEAPFRLALGYAALRAKRYDLARATFQKLVDQDHIALNFEHGSDDDRETVAHAIDRAQRALDKMNEDGE